MTLEKKTKSSEQLDEKFLLPERRQVCCGSIANDVTVSR
jgi:hypothetical protein